MKLGYVKSFGFSFDINARRAQIANDVTHWYQVTNNGASNLNVLEILRFEFNYSKLE